MHQPVLLQEVIKLLDPHPGDFFVDATFGSGGHSRAIWEKIKPQGRLLAIDWNKDAINVCRKNLREADCVMGNFSQLPALIQSHWHRKADGLLVDLGFSSDELENSGRGFSFKKNEPLLMTYSDEQKPVKDILLEISEKDLADVIRNYGEERFAGRIARSIKSAPRLATSKDLVDAIVRAAPSNYERRRIHPATRTFMALRIYANRELENLEKLLDRLSETMSPKGRVAIISFHSLEDRLVKNYFRNLKKNNHVELLAKKPITAGREELIKNPRARSAKLRALKFL